MSIDIQESIFGNVKTDIVTGALDALLTQRLGAGQHRTVYAIGEDNKEVLKIQHADHNALMRDNTIEFALWEDFQETKKGPRWLAKCIRISSNGRAMVQERLEIITEIDDPRLPKRIPRFITDTKVTNWGVAADGQVKCCDYGLLLLMQGNPWQLTKAEWYTL